MTHTSFDYAATGDERPATGYQPLPTLLASLLTPLMRAMLPAGVVAGRRGRHLAYHPFHVLGAAYGGLVGGVADAARLAMLHLGDGTLDGVRVLPANLTAQMRQIIPRGGPLDVGLGW